MRHLIMTSFAMFLLYATTIAQVHIVVPHDHSGRICYGYATGRAADRSSSDSNCNPNTLYQETINQAFFDFYSGSSLSGVANGDIIRFTDHAAYVVSVSSDINQIRVDETAAGWTTDSLNVPLANVIHQFGNPTGYYRRKTFSITVENSFGGGTINVGGGSVSSGNSVNLGWWTTHTLEATNQNYQASGESNYFRVFQNWLKNDANPDVTNPKVIQVDANATYKANFLKRFDITFQNSLPGASGGQIKVAGVTQNSPHSTQVIEDNSVSAEGCIRSSTGSNTRSAPGHQAAPPLPQPTTLPTLLTLTQSRSGRSTSRLEAQSVIRCKSPGTSILTPALPSIKSGAK